MIRVSFLPRPRWDGGELLRRCNGGDCLPPQHRNQPVIWCNVPWRASEWYWSVLSTQAMSDPYVEWLPILVSITRICSIFFLFAAECGMFECTTASEQFPWSLCKMIISTTSFQSVWAYLLHKVRIYIYMSSNAILLPTDDWERERERDKPLRSFDGQFLIMERGLEGLEKQCRLSVKKNSVSWRRGGDNVLVHSFLPVSTIWLLFLHNYPQRGRSNRNAESERVVASLSLKCLLVKYSAW